MQIRIYLSSQAMSGTWQPTSETKTTLALLSQAIVKDLSDEERRELNKAIQELSAERAAKRSPLVELVAHMVCTISVQAPILCKPISAEEQALPLSSVIEAVDYHFKKEVKKEKFEKIKH